MSDDITRNDVKGELSAKFNGALAAQVTTWLGSSEIGALLAPWNERSQDTISEKELGEALHDGTALLRLANAVLGEEGAAASLRVPVRESKLGFKQMENISTYLGLCSGAFGIAEGVLFDVIELYEVQNMAKVVAHLDHVRRTLPKLRACAEQKGGQSKGGRGGGKSLAAAATNKHAFGSSSRSPQAAHTALSTGLKGAPAGENPAFACVKCDVAVQNPPTWPKFCKECGAKNEQPVPEGFVAKPSGAGARRTAGAASPLPVRADGANADVASLNDDVAAKEALKFNPELERMARSWVRAAVGDQAWDAEVGAARRRLAKVGDALSEDAEPPTEDMLRSGVLLCQIVNEMVPDSVKRVHRSDIAFQHIENVANYMAACTSRAVGVAHTEKFDPSDLVEGKNFNVVIKNVHALARRAAQLESYTSAGKPLMEAEDTSKTRSMYSALLVGDDLRGSSGSNDPESELEASLVEYVNDQIAAHLSDSVSAGDDNDTAKIMIRNFASDVQDGEALLILADKLLREDTMKELIESRSSESSGRSGGRAVLRRGGTQSALESMRNHTILFRRLASAAGGEDVERITRCSPRSLVISDREAVCRLVEYMRDKFDPTFLFEQLLAKELGSAMETDTTASPHTMAQMLMSGQLYPKGEIGSDGDSVLSDSMSMVSSDSDFDSDLDSDDEEAQLAIERAEAEQQAARRAAAELAAAERSAKKAARDRAQRKAEEKREAERRAKEDAIAEAERKAEIEREEAARKVEEERIAAEKAEAERAAAEQAEAERKAAKQAEAAAAELEAARQAADQASAKEAAEKAAALERAEKSAKRVAEIAKRAADAKARAEKEAKEKAEAIAAAQAKWKNAALAARKKREAEAAARKQKREEEARAKVEREAAEKAEAEKAAAEKAAAEAKAKATKEAARKAEEEKRLALQRAAERAASEREALLAAAAVEDVTPAKTTQEVPSAVTQEKKLSEDPKPTDLRATADSTSPRRSKKERKSKRERSKTVGDESDAAKKERRAARKARKEKKGSAATSPRSPRTKKEKRDKKSSRKTNTVKLSAPERDSSASKSPRGTRRDPAATSTETSSPRESPVKDAPKQPSPLAKRRPQISSADALAAISQLDKKREMRRALHEQQKTQKKLAQKQKKLIKKASAVLSPEQQSIERAQSAVRHKIVSELLSTEETYVRSLRALDDFRLQVFASEVLSDEEQKLVFSSLQELTENHSRLLSALRTRLSGDRGVSLMVSVGGAEAGAGISGLPPAKKAPSVVSDAGDGVPAISDLLFHGVGQEAVCLSQFLEEAYRPYIHNFAVASSTVQFLVETNSGFANLVAEFEKAQQETTRLRLDGFLIVPVQRLPRYILLLRDASKYCPQRLEEHANMEKAMDFIDEKLKLINGSIDQKVIDNLQKALMIAGSIAECPRTVLKRLVEPSRKLLREGFVAIGALMPVDMHELIESGTAFIPEKPSMVRTRASAETRAESTQAQHFDFTWKSVPRKDGVSAKIMPYLFLYDDFICVTDPIKDAEDGGKLFTFARIIDCNHIKAVTTADKWALGLQWETKEQQANFRALGSSDDNADAAFRRPLAARVNIPKGWLWENTVILETDDGGVVIFHGSNPREAQLWLNSLLLVVMQRAKRNLAAGKTLSSSTPSTSKAKVSTDPKDPSSVSADLPVAEQLQKLGAVRGAILRQRQGLSKMVAVYGNSTSPSDVAARKQAESELALLDKNMQAVEQRVSLLSTRRRSSRPLLS